MYLTFLSSNVPFHVKILSEATI